MSIQNSTLHFHFPLVAASDRPIFGDYNAAMELLDEQLYMAVSSVTLFGEQIAALQEASGEHTTELSELNTFKTEQDGINTANTNRFLAINETLENQSVTNSSKFNSVSIADTYDATKVYNIGDVVTYNGDRYRCIVAVTTGMPFDADKWQGEDVQSALDDLNSDLPYATTNGRRIILDQNIPFTGGYTFPETGYYRITGISSNAGEYAQMLMLNDAGIASAINNRVEIDLPFKAGTKVKLNVTGASRLVIAKYI